jgi:dolichol-phosphate mannosyltransferase
VSGIFIVLPTLNEVENIASMIDGIERALVGVPHHLCVVDDGSTDGTVAWVRGYLETEGSTLTLIERKKTSRGSQRGIAVWTGLKWGLEHTQCDVFVEMDADLSHRPEELHEGVRLIREGGANLAIASKYVPGGRTISRPWTRRALSRVANAAVRNLISPAVRDYSNGYRFYDRGAVEAICERPIRYGSPIYLTESLTRVLGRGLAVVEFPSTYVGRSEGLSKLRPIDLVKASVAAFDLALRFHLRHGTWDDRAVLLLSSVLAGYAATWAFAVRFVVAIDDIGLFNPVYMFVQRGVMTYPAYGHFRSMVVHPPTHYWVLAWLVRAGIPIQYAVSIPPFLLIVMTLLLINRSTFTSGVKIALLFGFLVCPFLFQWSCGPNTFGITPNYHLAFAWFAGLIALETGRLQSWNPPRLGLGAFLLTYASGIHYPGSLAWTGAVVYLLWLIRALGWPKARRPAAALVLGGCLFGIPYLVCFVIPHWAELAAFVSSAHAMGTVDASLHEHIRTYRLWFAQFPPGFLTQLYNSPLEWGVPTVLLSTAILLPIPQLRGLALGSLPYLVFLLLFVQRKWNSYMFPELMLYTCSVCVLIAVTCSAVVERAGPRRKALVAPLLSLLCCVALVKGLLDLRPLPISLRPRVNELAVARAAGRQILGPRKLVGARLARFYTNGGDYSYMLEPDLLWRRDVEKLDLAAYFEQFDAVAEDTFSSELTLNDKRESLASWYAHGTLHLRGFFFSNRNEDGPCQVVPRHLSYLLLNAHPGARLQGYGRLDEREVAHFLEREDGDYEFVSAICPGSSLPIDGRRILFRNSYLLPRLDGDATTLHTLVLRRADYLSVQPDLRCALRSEVRLAMDTLPTRQLLATLENDPMIQFYEHLGEALEVRYGPEAGVETNAEAWPETFAFHRGSRKGRAWSLSDPSVRLVFSSEMDTTTGWSLERPLGSSGGLEVAASGPSPTSRSTRFLSGTQFDQLVTSFLQLPPLEDGLVFFSLWVRPLGGGGLPSLSLQNRALVDLAHARPVQRRSDGWVLLAGWVDEPDRRRVRCVVRQEAGAVSMLSKMYLATMPGADSHRVPADGQGAPREGTTEVPAPARASPALRTTARR